MVFVDWEVVANKGGLCKRGVRGSVTTKGGRVSVMTKRDPGESSGKKNQELLKKEQGSSNQEEHLATRYLPVRSWAGDVGHDL